MAAATRRQHRQDQRRRLRRERLFGRYQASGSTLPFSTWLKHDQDERRRAANRSDAIDVSPAFWKVTAALMIGVVAAIATVGIVGRAAGIW